MANKHVFRHLMEDHRNLKKVLAVLEQEIAMYETETGDPETEPNLNLVLEIMDYVHYYPEFFHHPLEEAAFDLLEKQGKGEQKTIESIREEHEQLEKISENVRGMLNGISVGNPTSLSDLRAAIDDFVDAQRRHIRKEENTVFKQIRTMSAEDCNTVWAQVEEHKDPVFGSESNQSQYEHLVESLD